MAPDALAVQAVEILGRPAVPIREKVAPVRSIRSRRPPDAGAVTKGACVGGGRPARFASPADRNRRKIFGKARSWKPMGGMLPEGLVGRDP